MEKTLQVIDEARVHKEIKVFKETNIKGLSSRSD